MNYRVHITKSKRGHYTVAIREAITGRRVFIENHLYHADEARRVAAEFIKKMQAAA